MTNLCYTVDDFRADGLLADGIVLGHFIKDNCSIPTINFIENDKSFFVYVKETEYGVLSDISSDLHTRFGMNIDTIKDNTDIVKYDVFRTRPILCSTTKNEFYTLDVDYLNIQNIDSIF